MTTPDDKLDVIRKLLAKAERAATAAEADTYNAKAAELMARYGVDDALLAAAGEKRDDVGSRRVAVSDPYSREKASLASSIIYAFGGKSVIHHGQRRGQILAVTMFGFESDLERAELLFTSLLLQATREVVRQQPPYWSDESTTAFRRTWLLGFSGEVEQRLEAAQAAAAAKRDTAQPGTGAELVLADRKSQVQLAFTDAFPNLKKARKRVVRGSGWDAGRAAGARADLGQTRVTAATRRTLG